MKILKLEAKKSHSQKRTFTSSLLLTGLVGSSCLHAAVMFTPVPTFWKTVNHELDDTIEVVVESAPSDNKPDHKIAEVPKQPEPINNQILPASAIEQPQPIEVAPLAIALAPEDPKPQQEGKDAPAPDNLKPLTTTGASETKIQPGGGPLIANNGIGSGFGNAKIPTGFVLGGKPNGNPNGSPNGILGGTPNGNPQGKGTQNAALPSPSAVPSQPPQPSSPPPKLECLSCPKPQYRGTEGTPRVTYDIAPDGRVVNVRLRQSSGDPQTDRETLEVMSKWQFNPDTVPEGGRTNVKVRVTFEEEGSQFQRQNEERRRQEAEQLAAQQAEQRRIAEENRIREAESTKPTAAVTPAPQPVAPVASPSLPVEPKTTPTAIEPIPTTPAIAPAPVVAPASAPIPPAPVSDPIPAAPIADPINNSAPIAPVTSPNTK